MFPCSWKSGRSLSPRLVVQADDRADARPAALHAATMGVDTSSCEERAGSSRMSPFMGTHRTGNDTGTLRHAVPAVKPFRQPWLPGPRLHKAALPRDRASTLPGRSRPSGSPSSGRAASTRTPVRGLLQAVFQPPADDSYHRGGSDAQRNLARHSPGQIPRRREPLSRASIRFSAISPRCSRTCVTNQGSPSIPIMTVYSREESAIVLEEVGERQRRPRQFTLPELLVGVPCGPHLPAYFLDRVVEDHPHQLVLVPVVPVEGYAVDHGRLGDIADRRVSAAKKALP